MKRITSLATAIVMLVGVPVAGTFAQYPAAAPNAAATTVPKFGPLQLVGRRPAGAGVRLGQPPLPGETLSPSPADKAAQKRARGPDAAFLRRALQGAMLQRELGLVEAARGKNFSTRQFAMRTAQGFDRAKARLEVLASEFQLPVSTMPSKQVLYERQWMDTAAPAAVDRDYVTHVVPAMDAEVRQFTTEVREGKNPVLVRYARNMLHWLNLRQQIGNHMLAVELAQNTSQATG
jgi:predicted outer membrane protein